MKKLLILLFSLLLLTGCGSNNTTNETQTNNNVIKVSCTAEPHATILEFVKPILSEQGYELDIEILDNFFIFNQALDAGDVDANYFQHVPFFEGEVETKGYDLVNVGGIHIEPFGIYSSKHESLELIPDGANVIISNSIADHGRILFILQDAGLIKLNDDVTPVNATVDDIKENPKNLTFKEVNPEFLTTAYSSGEGDLVAINGNYALSAGLNPLEDALILESTSNDNPYVNIVACKKGNENSNKIKALVNALTSEETKNFIIEKFGGSVIPAN